MTITVTTISVNQSLAAPVETITVGLIPDVLPGHILPGLPLLDPVPALAVAVASHIIAGHMTTTMKICKWINYEL